MSGARNERERKSLGQSPGIPGGSESRLPGSLPAPRSGDPLASAEPEGKMVRPVTLFYNATERAVSFARQEIPLSRVESALVRRYANSGISLTRREVYRILHSYGNTLADMPAILSELDAKLAAVVGRPIIQIGDFVVGTQISLHRCRIISRPSKDSRKAAIRAVRQRVGSMAEVEAETLPESDGSPSVDDPNPLFDLAAFQSRPPAIAEFAESTMREKKRVAYEFPNGVVITGDEAKILERLLVGGVSREDLKLYLFNGDPRGDGGYLGVLLATLRRKLSGIGVAIEYKRPAGEVQTGPKVYTYIDLNEIPAEIKGLRGKDAPSHGRARPRGEKSTAKQNLKDSAVPEAQVAKSDPASTEPIVLFQREFFAGERPSLPNFANWVFMGSVGGQPFSENTLDMNHTTSVQKPSDMTVATSKVENSSHEDVARVAFRLPNGMILRGDRARILQEARSGGVDGIARSALKELLYGRDSPQDQDALSYLLNKLRQALRSNGADLVYKNQSGEAGGGAYAYVDTNPDPIQIVQLDGLRDAYTVRPSRRERLASNPFSRVEPRTRDTEEALPPPQPATVSGEDREPKEQEVPLVIIASGRQIRVNGQVLELSHAEAVVIRKLDGGISLTLLADSMASLKVPRRDLPKFLQALNSKIQAIAGRAVIGASDGKELESIIVGLNNCYLQAQTPGADARSLTRLSPNSDKPTSNTRHVAREPGSSGYQRPAASGAIILERKRVEIIRFPGRLSIDEAAVIAGLLYNNPELFTINGLEPFPHDLADRLMEASTIERSQKDLPRVRVEALAQLEANYNADPVTQKRLVQGDADLTELMKLCQALHDKSVLHALKTELANK